MKVKGSRYFSVGVNCCCVGRERPWRVLESDTRIQCFKSTLVVIIVGTVVGYSHFLNLATSILFYSPGLGWIFDPDLVVFVDQCGKIVRKNTSHTNLFPFNFSYDLWIG